MSAAPKGSHWFRPRCNAASDFVRAEHHKQSSGGGGEVRGRLAQTLAVLATVGETAARWAATGQHERAAKTEESRRADQLRHEAGRVRAAALAEQDRAAHRFMDRAFDQQWLSSADLRDVADLWRTAAMYAGGGDPRALEAMRRAAPGAISPREPIPPAPNRRRPGRDARDDCRAPPAGIRPMGPWPERTTKNGRDVTDRAAQGQRRARHGSHECRCR
jgi:hypothetical protein